MVPVRAVGRPRLPLCGHQARRREPGRRHLTDAGSKRALFITLGGYTGDARHLADKHGIEVVNEAGLAKMHEATDARFDPTALEILADTRKLCPKCEREMVLRTASK